MLSDETLIFKHDLTKQAFTEKRKINIVASHTKVILSFFILEIDFCFHMNLNTEQKPLEILSNILIFLFLCMQKKIKFLFP